MYLSFKVTVNRTWHAEPLRMNLKIRGTIREVGQKGKLIYVRWSHQVKQTKLIGYAGQEITNVVISSVSPSLTLRTAMETTSNLSLDRLQQFLEAHFQQKNGTRFM